MYADVKDNHLEQFEFLGRLLGKAVYEEILGTFEGDSHVERKPVNHGKVFRQGKGICH